MKKSPSLFSISSWSEECSGSFALQWKALLLVNQYPPLIAWRYQLLLERHPFCTTPFYLLKSWEDKTCIYIKTNKFESDMDSMYILLFKDYLKDVGWSRDLSTPSRSKFKLENWEVWRLWRQKIEIHFKSWIWRLEDFKIAWHWRLKSWQLRHKDEDLNSQLGRSDSWVLLTEKTLLCDTSPMTCVKI